MVACTLRRREGALSTSSKSGLPPCPLSRCGGGFDVVIACEVVYKQAPEVLRALAAAQG